MGSMGRAFSARSTEGLTEKSGLAIDRTSYGISLPQTWKNLEGFRQHCLLIEKLGFGSAWVADYLCKPDDLLEPFTALSYCAAVTSRVRLGIAISVSFARSPVLLAQAVASLDRISDGRLEMGVGSGLPSLAPAFGVAEEDAFNRFRSSLRTLKHLWTTTVVSDRSQFWDLREWSVGLRPVQQPYPPLWIGARMGPALRLAAEEGTGWIGAGSSSLDDFRRQLRTVRRHLEEIGRDPESFRVAKRIHMHVSDGGADRLEDVRASLGSHYGDANGADRFAVIGDAVSCAEQVNLHRD